MIPASNVPRRINTDASVSTFMISFVRWPVFAMARTQ
jgi:hypothetical protein